MATFDLQKFPFPRARRNLGYWIVAGNLFLLAFCSYSLAQVSEQPPPKKAATFSTILEEQTGKTFEMIKSYLQENPQASDAEQAYEWLFNTAQEQGWEAKAVPLAEEYLKRPETTLATKNLAASLRTVGSAKSGKWEEALLGFEKHLADVRLRMPTQTVELAQTLSVQAQVAGQPEIAREIYKNLSRTLFLNPEVRTLCETNLAKLKLVGQAAPQVSVRDLEDRPVSLADFQGKWVLLDFWATNCPPCLKAFPHLKDLQEAHKSQGFTILGISLDEDADTVRAFQKTHKLPWSLALSQTDEGQTRERYHVPTIPALYLINPQGKLEVIDPTPQDLAQILKARLKPNADRPPPPKS